MHEKKQSQSLEFDKISNPELKPRSLPTKLFREKEPDFREIFFRD